jgi:hypothetical protein
VEGVTKRGVGGLEMLAIELKATGAYLSRGLSYKGAQFELRVSREHEGEGWCECEYCEPWV